jgi:hypothetical protein
VERDVRLHRQQVIAGDRAGARDRRAAGVAGGDHAVRPRGGDQRRVLERGLERAEARLGKPHALLGDLAEVVAIERRLENDRAGMHLHAAGAIVRETLVRGDRQRLHPVGVARPARDMDLRRADRRGHSAVQVAFEIADGVLARREIAERDVHMRIDQAGNGGGAARVDHHVAGLDIARRCGADCDDPIVLADDRIALHKGRGEIAGDDGADVDDRNAHGSSG